MKKAIRIFLFANLFVTAATSQNSFDTLDVNNIHAGFNASGDLFYNINTFGAPITTSSNTIVFSAANLWIGGFDPAGDLHISAQTYRQTGSDFWPGPLDTILAYCDTNTSNSYNYVWNLTCAEVDSFISYTQSTAPPGYPVPLEIQTWPGNGNPANNESHNLAPYYDADGDGQYNFAAGDYPLIRGSQSLFYVYNDSLQYTPHTETGSSSLGIQIKAMPYAYYYPWDDALMNTIFIHYTITNYKTFPFYGTRIGFWYDLDFSNGGHDGSDSTAQVSYHYNTDNAIGVYFLSDSMSGCINYNNDFTVTGNPQSAMDYYQVLNQQWTSTQGLTYGGSGYNTGAPTSWMYTGDPVNGSGWTDNTTVTDHRTVVTLDSFVLYPGMTKEFTIALSFAYDTTSPYASFTMVNQYINQVRQFYAGNQGYCNLQLSSVTENAQPEVAAYPNPTNDVLNVTGSTPGDCYSIFDINGNLVITGKTTSESFSLDVSTLSAGIYFLQLTSYTETSTIRFVKAE